MIVWNSYAKKCVLIKNLLSKVETHNFAPNT